MRIILSLLIATTLAGCASTQVAQSELIAQQALQQAANHALTPQEVIAQSEEKLKEAQQENLAFFSPRYLGHAKQEFETAQSLIKEKGQEKLALTSALKSQSYVDAGIKNKAIVEENLVPVLDKKLLLETIESPKFEASDYKSVVDDISDLIQLIEAGKLIEALEDQPSVLKSMTNVEIETLKTIHLTDAINMLDKADDDDADVYAKATFNLARRVLEKSTEFIEKNYTDHEQIEAKGIEALKAAQHAFYVAIESQQLIQIKAEAAEKHILLIEKLFHRIGTGLSHEDIRYMSLSDQSTILAQQTEIIGKRLKNRPTVQEKSLWENNKQLLLKEIEALKAQLATYSGEAFDETPYSAAKSSTEDEIESNTDTEVTASAQQDVEKTTDATSSTQSADTEATSETTTP